MLKLTSLAIALLTVISIAPKSDAAMTIDRHLSHQHPTGELHAQIHAENRHHVRVEHRRDRDRRQVVKHQEHHGKPHSKAHHDR